MLGHNSRSDHSADDTMPQPILIRPGTRVRLRDFDPDDTSLCGEKDAAHRKVEHHVRRMADLQHLLFANAGHALLIVLQGMDASGKDGTIRHVMSGLNPLGCRAMSFKAPTPEERAHDFLWRVHREVPPLGWIGIFNRSHYEDVVAARVRGLVPRPVWRGRYEPINDFEKLLAKSGVTLLKFFLHISKQEQKKRLEERLKDPRHARKGDPVDWEDRRLRQVDAPAPADRPLPAERGRGAAVGTSPRSANDRAAAAAPGIRDPGGRTLSAPDGGRQRHARRAVLRLGRAAHRESARGTVRSDTLSARRGGSLSRAALGRAAPACQPDAGADARTRAAPPRRAARRARPDDSSGAASRS